MDDAASLSRTAVEAGAAIDLSGCMYGPTHWGPGFSTESAGYYALLAGLVRANRFTRVCELGTHYGGATLAMARGFPAAPAPGRIVTIDVTALDNPSLTAEPRIERVQGDVLSPAVLDQVSARFDRHVDLMFVDIVHGYHQTKRALGMYANRLKPAVIVLDDVHLNGGMDQLWREIVRAHDSFDATALCGREHAGIGVVVPRYPCAFDEGDAWRVPLWSARRAVAARLPYAAKERIGKALELLPGPLRKVIDPS